MNDSLCLSSSCLIVITITLKELLLYHPRFKTEFKPFLRLPCNYLQSKPDRWAKSGAAFVCSRAHVFISLQQISARIGSICFGQRQQRVDWPLSYHFAGVRLCSILCPSFNDWQGGDMLLSLRRSILRCRALLIDLSAKSIWWAWLVKRTRTVACLLSLSTRNANNSLACLASEKNHSFQASVSQRQLWNRLAILEPDSRN